MILDTRLMFVDKTSVVGAVGTNPLGNVIDTGIAHRDLGSGQDLFFFVEVVTSIIAAAGAGTVSFQLITSASSTMSSPVVIAGLITQPIGVAATGLVVAGAQFYLAPLPQEGVTYLEYLGIQAVVTGNPITSGAISCGLTLDRHGWQSYPRNYA